MERPSRIELSIAPPIGIAAVGVTLVAAAATGAMQPELRALAVFVVAFPVLWIALATLFSYSTVRGLRKVAAEMPLRTRAMETFRLGLTLAHRRRGFPAIGVLTNVRFTIAGASLEAGPWAEIPILESGRAATTVWDVVAKKRGTLRIGPFRATVELPGSALRATAVFVGTHTVTVLPAVYHLQPFVDALLAGRHIAAGRFRPLPVATEEYFGAREFRPGDPPKHIHRILSLRALDPDKFFVREFEDPSRDDLSVVLDTAPPADGDDALRRYRLEKAICFVSALCKAFAARRLNVRFVFQRGAGEIMTLRLRPLDVDLERLDLELAHLDLTGDRNVLGRALVEETRRAGPAVIFVSLRSREPVEQQRLPMVTLTPDHVPVFTREVVAS